VLVLGGARSGKSRFAERLASGTCHYIATAQAFDNEMRERIAQHQVQRGAHWVTYEEPLNLVERLASIDGPQDFILVDCLTLWLTNLMLAERDCDAAVQKFAAHLQTTVSRIVIVSNEVGLGIVPDNKLARAFRDIQGLANRRVAEVANSVVFMAAGLPMLLKGPLPTAQS
jgi:adenosylcobinamide kinase/adenosylcobinamide-phosphate guanylyltransferase